MSTPVGTVRDPIFFQHVKNVKVLNQTEAIRIDRERKRVQVRDLAEGRESWLDYDKLVLGTGTTTAFCLVSPCIASGRSSNRLIC